MAWFWKRQERPEPEAMQALRERVASVETDLRALARDLIDLDKSVARWLKRAQREAREAEGIAERSAGEVDTPGMGAATDGPAPPPDLRGARLRIWKRRHGLTAPPVVNGEAEA